MTETEGTMICDTVWDKPPECVVFKGHGDWPWYVPERTCKDKAKSGPYFWCDSCNQFIIYPNPPNYCPECGAKVVDE